MTAQKGTATCLQGKQQTVDNDCRKWVTALPPSLTGGDNGYCADTGPTQLFHAVTWSTLGQGLNYTFCGDTGTLGACSQPRAWCVLAPVCGSLWFSAIINQDFFPQGNRCCTLTYKPTSRVHGLLSMRLLLPSRFPLPLLPPPIQPTQRKGTPVKQLHCNTQILCIPGPHCQQPTHSPRWHAHLLPKAGMLLLF